MRKTIFQAVAIAAMVATTAGATGSERHLIRTQTAWAQLSADQREMIDLVAGDIWSTERRGRVPFSDLPERKKSDLRNVAMDRLGFEMRPPRGVEA